MIGDKPSFVAKNMSSYEIIRTLVVTHDLIAQLEIEPIQTFHSLENLGSHY